MAGITVRMKYMSPYQKGLVLYKTTLHPCSPLPRIFHFSRSSANYLIKSYLNAAGHESETQAAVESETRGGIYCFGAMTSTILKRAKTAKTDILDVYNRTYVAAQPFRRSFPYW